ncbi:MAG: histidine ammonia-lyase [Acidobacteria bacterium]|nr:histidine ammonia-lyase [Acidobacteriota bacterium]MSO61678.1 histidine ammonia-lyase [Acidobacteriota bacterium]
MILLDGATLSLTDLLAIADHGVEVGLAPSARTRVAAARAVVDAKTAGNEPVYGVNTGFGNFAETRIEKADLAALQLNLLRSHAAGVDEPLPVRAVRATMALRANVLAKGYSGIRVETLEALLALLNRRVHPRVPSRGSVGASGDLAPLAHLALVLVGEGDTWNQDIRLSGAAALLAAGLAPVVLGPKEGLALINGTQVSTAVLALALAGAERLSRAADVAAALSIDGLMGSMHPFDARIHDARPFAGQGASAANLRRLMDGSAINASHVNCGRVQDAYSMRCTPQVHGAAREALTWIRHVVTTEMNAATDNPMVFADEGDMVSGGNFHGAPLALAADLLVMAVAQLATISERRSERLVNPALSGLPAFLTRHGGLQSGFMIAQVTAAALTSEIKTLAHPASVDTIPTSANKEDHVSMSMHAALKAERVLQLVTTVIGIEVLCGCQAIDLHAPLRSSEPLMRAHAAVRKRVPTLVDDRSPAPDIDAITELIRNGGLEHSIGVVVN